MCPAFPESLQAPRGVPIALRHVLELPARRGGFGHPERLTISPQDEVDLARGRYLSFLRGVVDSDTLKA